MIYFSLCKLTGKTHSLGDSSFLLFRSDQVVHVQRPQTHFFNCPRQLAKMPAEFYSDDNIVDLPGSADVFTTNLK
jgi:protein phosphatase PTC7